MSADLAGRSSMNRRTVVAGCVALAGTPVGGEAQPAATVYASEA